MAVLKRIDPISMGKMAAIVYSVLGLLWGMVFSLFAVLLSGITSGIASTSTSQSLPSLPVPLPNIGLGPLLAFAGIFGIVASAIFAGIFGFIVGAVGAVLYNFIASKVGGIYIDISDK